MGTAILNTPTLIDWANLALDKTADPEAFRKMFIGEFKPNPAIECGLVVVRIRDKEPYAVTAVDRDEVTLMPMVGQQIRRPTERFWREFQECPK